jgi:hypothetical protein
MRPSRKLVHKGGARHTANYKQAVCNTETARPLNSIASLFSFLIHYFHSLDLLYYLRVCFMFSDTESLSNTLYAFFPFVFLFTPISFLVFLVLFHSPFIIIVSFQLVLFNDPIQ